ncbi:MAG: tetratricopeptide repeat protein, partial [Deltaproteobacteria bacterium]|nr:tetratricopeptide repeat protein [Deltaproteobacteria bacterium]
MKKNILNRGILAVLVPLLLLVMVPGLGLAGNENDYFQKGTRLLKQGKLDQAARALTKAIHLAPDHVEAYNNRGLAYFEQKKYPEAQKDFFTALELSPDDQEANNNLGIFFCGQEDYDRALVYFQRAVEKSDAPTTFDLVVYRNLAFVYRKKGMTEEAAKASEKARSIQDKVSEDLDLRPYGEGTREYTLTLEFSTMLVQKRHRFKSTRHQSEGG